MNVTLDLHYHVVVPVLTKLSLRIWLHYLVLKYLVENFKLFYFFAFIEYNVSVCSHETYKTAAYTIVHGLTSHAAFSFPSTVSPCKF